MEKEIKNSEAFIKGLLDNHSGFRTPKSYFEELDEKIQLGVLENSFSKTEGFDIPENYFKNFEDSLLNKVKEDKKHKNNLTIYRVLKFAPLLAAASVVVILTFNFFNLKKNELTNNEIIYWFQNNLETVNQDDLVLAFENADSNDFGSFTANLSETHIEEYFKSEDITNLIEELN